MKKLKKILIEQITPIFLTFIIFCGLVTILYGLLLFLNSLNPITPIVLDLSKKEILFGIIIYLKTAIDFAILMGSLMQSNTGWKKRIAIALGTALGNGAGTFIALTVWVLFRDIPLLMMVLVFIASIILLKMAEESFEFFLSQKNNFVKLNIIKPVSLLQGQLNFLNGLFRPILNFFVPDLNLTKTKKLSFINLIVFSFTIPFVLGINDFTAYVPLSYVINIFGFSFGLLLGHMILTIGLFTFSKKTIYVVKHPIVLIAGGLFFVFLALYGFYRTFYILIDILS